MAPLSLSLRLSLLGDEEVHKGVDLQLPPWSGSGGKAVEQRVHGDLTAAPQQQAVKKASNGSVAKRRSCP